MQKNYTSKRKKELSRSKLKYFILLFFSVGLLNLYSQQTYTFTTCGATGSVGPTPAMTSTAYASTNLNGLVVNNAGVQSFTIPIAGNYKIEAWGAAGGTQLFSPGYPGGKGAYMSGSFTFSAGTVLKIIVGQMGGNTQGVPADNAAPGGGGGSFVYINATDPTPLIAAGGGGGGGRFPGSLDANTTTSANVAFIGAPGGINGNGGGVNAGIGSSYWAGSGAGWLTDGTGGNQSTIYNYLAGSTGAGGGRRPANGAQGGVRYNDGTDEGGDGGFGGGGGGGSDNMGTGGGGGYSGGGGASGTNNNTGGGGGSFNSGINQLNTAATNTTHGKVVITELCNISLTSSGSNSLNPSICSGQSLTLTTNAVSNYSWSTGNTTSSDIVVSPTITTIYTLSAMSVSNCITTNSIQVIVSGGQPTLSVVSSTNQTCLGKTATLTASGAVTYTWTNGVTNGVSFFPQSTNTYTVTGENGCGTVTAVSTISILPLPLTVATTNSVICTNKTATLSATAAATSYTWQPGNIIGASPNLIVNPQANTNYTITATDGTCVGVANVSVNANPVPTIQIASSATTACPGDVVTFTASGGSNYTWTANNQTGTTLSTSLSTTTLITVQGDNQFGCISNTSQVVSVQTAPTINVATASPSICSGSSSTLNVTGANSYTWTGGSNGNSFVVNPSQTTVYSVDGSNTGNPCISTKTLEITVFTPVLTITGNTVICNGAQTNLTAGSASTYSWTHDAPFYNANTSVSPNTNTTYTVNATHEFNGGQVKCPISGTIEVIVNPTPTISAIATRTSMCAKETNTLNANGASTYTWVTTNTTIAANSLTINPTTATILTYTLNGTSAQGCEANTVFLFNVSSCTGIEESKTNNVFVNIYPNPSQGNFTIETGKEMQLKLINQLGQIVEVIQLNEKNNYKTSLSNLSNGVYFISGNDLNKKVIVNK